MGFEASSDGESPDSDQRLERLYRLLVEDDSGQPHDPSTHEDWDEWLTPSSLNGSIKENPLSDWLDRYGSDAGFCADSKDPGYDRAFDFVYLLLRRGDAFEKAVYDWLKPNLPGLTWIGSRGHAARTLEHARLTARAMLDQVPAIAQGVLRNPQERLYGSPDLLVRSDLVATLFPNPPQQPAPFQAPNLGGFGYVVVDAKFFRRRPENTHDAALLLLNAVHNNIYNRMLGRLCGAAGTVSYLLGRGPVDACLIPIDHLRHGNQLLDQELEARDWVRRLRAEGGAWRPLPEPTVPMLRPNMKARYDIGWTTAVRQIAEQQHDITMLPFCGTDKRRLATAAGISRWDDPQLTPTLLRLSVWQAKQVDRILQANRPGNTAPIVPAQVVVEDDWRIPASLDVFCAVQSIDDLSAAFPSPPPPINRRTAAIAYTAVADGVRIERRSLVAAEVSDSAQTELIGSFRDAILSLARARGIEESDVRLYQWSVNIPKEAGFTRLDMRYRLFQSVPLGVRGALGPRLHEVAATLRQQGLISATFPDHPEDGAEAAAATWHAAEDSATNGTTLSDSPLVAAVCAYHQARCGAMAQILQYLRQNVFTAISLPLGERDGEGGSQAA